MVVLTSQCALCSFHCHNAVHEDRDMMMAFAVVPPNVGQKTAAGTGFDADIAKCALPASMQQQASGCCLASMLQDTRAGAVLATQLQSCFCAGACC